MSENIYLQIVALSRASAAYSKITIDVERMFTNVNNVKIPIVEIFDSTTLKRFVIECT